MSPMSKGNYVSIFRVRFFPEGLADQETSRRAAPQKQGDLHLGTSSATNMIKNRF
jgi:hypothetical protein